jgi:hypothetical protein
MAKNLWSYIFAGLRNAMFIVSKNVIIKEYGYCSKECYKELWAAESSR